jgi:hypothetical protein
MNKISFVIEKNINGHVVKLVKDSEVWEIDSFNKANEICDVLNTNTDSGCEYTVIPINSSI